MKLSLTYTITLALILVVFAVKNADRQIAPAVVAASVEEGTVYSKDMNVSAYCLCEKCCGRWAKVHPRRTASGHIIQPGDHFVAAPKSYPFGTRMIIPGYNNGQVVTVQDRGGAIKEGRDGQLDKLDLFYPTHKEALQWGRKTVKVKVYVE